MNCPENNFLKPPPWWERVEVLGGQKIKSPGNFMNCRENGYIFFTPPPSEDGEREGRTGGGGKGEGGRQGRRGRAKPGNQLVLS